MALGDIYDASHLGVFFPYAVRPNDPPALLTGLDSDQPVSLSGYSDSGMHNTVVSTLSSINFEAKRFEFHVKVQMSRSEDP